MKKEFTFARLLIAAFALESEDAELKSIALRFLETTQQT